MNEGAPVEPHLGRIVVAYADPWAGSWAWIALGAALFAGGAILLPLAIGTIVAPHRGDAMEDLVAGAVLGGMLFFGGLGLLVWSIRDRLQRPSFYVCEHGLAKVGTKGTRWSVAWQDVGDVVIVRVMRTGRIIGYRLRLGRRLVFVPTEQIAEQARGLWAATIQRSQGMRRAGAP